MGDMTMRLRKVTDRIVSGLSRSISGTSRSWSVPAGQPRVWPGASLIVLSIGVLLCGGVSVAKRTARKGRARLSRSAVREEVEQRAVHGLRRVVLYPMAVVRESHDAQVRHPMTQP